MSRSSFLAVLCALVTGCATASSDGVQPSDGAASHDSAQHAVDSGAASDGTASDGVALDDTSSTTDSASASDTTGATDTTSGSDTTSGADATATDPTCAASSTNNDCQMCCYTAHTDAYNAFAAALSTCACKPANCQTQCAATACASPPVAADSTCVTCLKAVQTGACKPDIDAVCGSPSGACYPFAQCVITSACNSKP